MTKHEAETTPLIELCELAIDCIQHYGECYAEQLVDKVDRYDLITELEEADAFEEEE